MKKKLVLLTSLFTFVAGALVAQQDKLITHFMFDKMSLNPGETGVDQGYNSICATSVYRNQWDKVNGAPNSAILNIESNLQKLHGGIGISFFHDAIGFSRQNNVLLNYAWHQPVGNAGVLSGGLGLGIVNFGMSPVWVPPTTAVDPTLPVGFSATNLDLNFGVYWKGNSNYYAGLSSTHLNQSILSQTVGGSLPQTYEVARHYYVMGGKKFLGLIGSDGDLDAQVLMRTDLVKFSADVNVRYIWKNKLYGGLTYRTSDAVCIMLGWTPIPNTTIGYAYDVTTNKLSSVSRGSHEILLKYCYYLPKPPITISNHPRWL
jgi:type IX secretion system PorP/SprF family membrane protein